MVFRVGDGTLRNRSNQQFALTAMCPDPSGHGPFYDGMKVGIHTSTPVGVPAPPAQDWTVHNDGTVRLTQHPQFVLTALCSDPMGNGPFHTDLAVGIWTVGPWGPAQSQKWQYSPDGSIRLAANPQLALTTRVPDPSGNSGFHNGCPCVLWTVTPWGSAVAASQFWTTFSAGSEVNFHAALQDSGAKDSTTIFFQAGDASFGFNF